jgi:hypothetical protein
VQPDVPVRPNNPFEVYVGSFSRSTVFAVVALPVIRQHHTNQIPTLSLPQASITYFWVILLYIFPSDVTWKPLANVNDCAAKEEYLAHCDVNDPPPAEA